MSRWDSCPAAVSAWLYRGSRTHVVLNGSHPLTRRRFSLAHEIGHWYRGDAGSFVLMLAEPVDGEGERWANQFAAELLMPSGIVRALVDAGCGVEVLCRRLAVSRQAMTRQLWSLGLT